MCTISCVSMLGQDKLLLFEWFSSFSVWKDVLRKQILVYRTRSSPHKLTFPASNWGNLGLNLAYTLVCVPHPTQVVVVLFINA